MARYKKKKRKKQFPVLYIYTTRLTLPICYTQLHKENCVRAQDSMKRQF